MLNQAITVIGKIASRTSSLLNLGHGSTWPGHIALSINKDFIKEIIHGSGVTVIMIAGTNGKTTTAKMLRTILEESGKKVIQNHSGANLRNGIASTLILRSTFDGKIKSDIALFEVDENTLPHLLKDITPDYLILLNLFRDQLDRYGEVNTIASKWKDAIEALPSQTHLILNADDPKIAFIGMTGQHKTSYFGLEKADLTQSETEHAADSVHCPRCGNRLRFKHVAYSHLGEWSCSECKLSHPDNEKTFVPLYPLTGLYNRYNTIASVLTSHLIGVSEVTIKNSLKKITPAFGRQEMFEVEGKKVQLFLSKNPTSMNESLRTIISLKAKHLLFVLNDRIPDGRDVSWIWDVDIETFLNPELHVSTSGDRAYDMSLRLKYAHPHVEHVDTYPLLEKGAVHQALEKVKPGETLYVLPTYSAMLEVRKVLSGRKIL